MGKSDLEKSIKTAEELTKELLKKLQVEADVKTSEVESAVQIDVDGDDLGLLIGYHGETLEALQLLLGLMVNKEIGNEGWVPVNLDIGGWKAKRAQVLKSMVEKAASDIEGSDEASELPPMPASQRRTVHLILADFPNLTSESIGEEPNRKVIIKKA
jgi:spoIIIJ-associated protein